MQRVPFLEIDGPGLHKIISGGQTGSDRGALEAAVKYGIETGGWAPANYRTTIGPDPDLAKFGLRTTTSANYSPRTELNVREGDGTLLVASNFESPGEILTLRLCRKYEKPFFKYLVSEIGNLDAQLLDWIDYWGIGVLNVAGNRDLNSTKHFDAAFQVVSSLIQGHRARHTK